MRSVARRRSDSHSGLHSSRTAWSRLVDGMRSVRSSLTWALFIVPALAIYVAFLALPLFNSIRYSFYTGPGIVPDRFVGLENFVTLVTNDHWRFHLLNALRNTAVFFFIHMAVQNTLGLLFASLLSGDLQGANVFRTIIFLPATMSVLVIGFLWRLMLNPRWGVVNYTLEAVGLGALARPWLGDPGTALVAIALVSCWQWVGLPTMMYLCALVGIPHELTEAAMVDGANGWQVFWRVKFPLLVPIIGVVSILTFIGNFSAFDIIYAMASSRGDPRFATDILGSFFYRTAIGGGLMTGRINAGIGAAIAAVIFVILLAGVLLWLSLSGGEHLEN